MSREKVMGYNYDYVDGYINLTGSISGQCTDLCQLNIVFDELTKFTMTNNSGSGYLTYTPINISNTTKILWNSTQYTFKYIQIYRQSLHQYGGSFVDAELIIYCISTSSSDQLWITIPIVNGMSTTSLSTTTEKMILEANRKIPNTGDTGNTTYGINLNNLIVKKNPFLKYNVGSYAHGIKGTRIAYKLDNAIKLSDKTISSLKQTIKTQTENPLYIYAGDDPDKDTNRIAPVEENPYGAAKQLGGDDQIYIDCKPTGGEDNKMVLEEKPNMIGDEAKKIIAIVLKFLVAIIAVKIIWSMPKFLVKRGKPSPPPVKTA